MTKIYTCSVCDSEFKNSHSLSSHKYKFHPNTSKSTTDKEVKQKMEYVMSDDGQFKDSIIQSELYSNKTNSEAGESSLYEFDFHKDKAMLIKYIERLPKLVRCLE